MPSVPESPVTSRSKDYLKNSSRIDTNNCMNLTTRERLLQAATRLFADNGYRGASVRDICNLAGANPGAVSYHFGGKRQLYRSVLRRAAAGLADMGPAADNGTAEREPISVLDALRRLLDRMQSDDAATRLLLRDLADGGTVAVESLTPPLRTAFEQLVTALGHGDNPRASSEGRLLSRPRARDGPAGSVADGAGSANARCSRWRRDDLTRSRVAEE